MPDTLQFSHVLRKHGKEGRQVSKSLGATSRDDFLGLPGGPVAKTP